MPELDRVAEWFSSDGTYYDVMSNIRSVADHLVQARCSLSRRHMKGLTNTKTLSEFPDDKK